jgi:hypothetical protein
LLILQSALLFDPRGQEPSASRKLRLLSADA